MGKNPNLIYWPHFHYYEVKNPNRLFPPSRSWEEIYGEENVRYEDNPVYDENGNYLGTNRDVFITMKKVIGYTIMRRNKPAKPKAKKLFETYSDKIKKLEEEEEETK